MRKWMEKTLALAAVAISVGFAKNAKATSITGTLETVSPYAFPTIYLQGEGDLSGGVGQIQWQGVSTNAAPFNGAFDTYCIDLIQDIYFGSTYTFTEGALSSGPNPGAYPDGQTGGMGTAKADEIDELFGSDYSATLASGQTGDDDREAFQLAIWSIIYNNDTSVSNTSDPFYVVSGIDANAISTANSWLVEAADPANQDLDATNVIGLFAENGAQDQVALGGPTVDRLTPAGVPLPSSAAMGGALLAGAMVIARIRRAVRA
jgi:hypothetical protein